MGREIEEGIRLVAQAFDEGADGSPADKVPT